MLAADAARPGVPAAAQTPAASNGFNNAQAYVPVKRRYDLMKDLMFHAKATGSPMPTAACGPSTRAGGSTQKKTATPDQGGRRVYRDEIILVARTPTLSDRADAVAQDPGSRHAALARPPARRQVEAAGPARLPVRRKPTSASTSRVQPNQPDGADKP